MGDALGAFFEFSSGAPSRRLTERILPPLPWRWTDDTQMALSVFSVLRAHGRIDQDELAASLATHYERERGYGLTMRGMMHRLRQGKPWQQHAPALFGGRGSFGNGGATRVPPLGAFFAQDIERAALEAQSACAVTHAHPEALAGARAVAAATALAWQGREQPPRSRDAFLAEILPLLAPSEVRDRLTQASNLSSTITVTEAASRLGNGSQVSAQDTVPFALWCAAGWLDNYEEAIWQTLDGGGDCDSTCAIVGGIVVMARGIEGIPERWHQAREPLPGWPFR